MRHGDDGGADVGAVGVAHEDGGGGEENENAPVAGAVAGDAVAGSRGPDGARVEGGPGEAGVLGIGGGVGARSEGRGCGAARAREERRQRPTWQRRGSERRREGRRDARATRGDAARRAVEEHSEVRARNPGTESHPRRRRRVHRRGRHHGVERADANKVTTRATRRKISGADPRGASFISPMVRE